MTYDWNNDDFDYDSKFTSSSFGDYGFFNPEPLVKHDKLLKDIQECKSVNDFLRRIGEDLQWEDLR